MSQYANTMNTMLKIQLAVNEGPASQNIAVHISG